MRRTIVGSVLAAVAMSTLLIAPSTAAPPAVGATATEIVGVRDLGKGVRQYVVITPTADANPSTLRESLRTRGYRTDTTARDASQCSPHIGTAWALCGAKWSYGPFNDPQVYFLDHSGDTWPVTDARVDWYQAPGIDAYYRWYTSGCPGGGRHCVSVYSGAYGQNGKYAETTWRSSGGYFVDGSVQIKLNDSTTPRTYAARRSVACHEMGHALGLGHNDGGTSCVKTYLFQSPAFPQHPTSNDFNVLKTVYPKAGT